MYTMDLHELMVIPLFVDFHSLANIESIDSEFRDLMLHFVGWPFHVTIIVADVYVIPIGIVAMNCRISINRNKRMDT